MTTFSGLEPRAPDAILGLMERFRADPRADKVSLASGVYVDESGTTPVLATVREAEARVLAGQTPRSTSPSTVTRPSCGPCVTSSSGPTSCRAERPGRPPAHARRAPGPCASPRTSCGRCGPMPPCGSRPRRGPTTRRSSRLPGPGTQGYPYLGADGSLDLDALLEALRAVPAGDVVLLHACCHNPTGIDPTPRQWSAIADVPWRPPAPYPSLTSPIRGSRTACARMPAGSWPC